MSSNLNSKSTILGFYGKSDSGKTTLVERLIQDLTDDGFKVAAVKKTDQSISFDSAGKDTHRYALAGAKLVVFSSQIETALLIKSKISEMEIIADIQRLENYDFIFIEGANEETTPKIRMGNIAIRRNTLFTYDGNFIKLMDLIKSKRLNKEI
jgi:molybdopterin-guanine dinucleotide biosynthesis adapter protein